MLTDRLAPSWLLTAIAVTVLAPASARARDEPPGVAPTEARSPEEERAGFHLPPGFVAQLVADETQIRKPMNLAFDDRGRLWITETVEYPYPAQEGEPHRDAVVILDDFTPDGRARKVTTFADGLNIPIGVIPLGNGSSALVHSIPAIWRLTDADGDGKAEKREVAYSAFASADTHGMTSNFTWGFDGWIYADHGFANTSEVKGADGQKLVMNSGNTYRMKPDGSGLQQFTHGQVNPFGLSFSPSGDLYSADCHTKPLYLLLRGAYYPSFGKPDDGLGFGPEMVTHDHGSTAIDAALYYAAEQFPAPFRDNLFVGNVMTNRINRDTIRWHGSTPEGVAQPDFLVSDDPWFRPVAMQVGPDGALYIADFYNRIIGHYEVPLDHPGRDRTKGRIWRIVYQGPESHAEPVAPRTDWTQAPTAALLRDLGHPNLVVRVKAANQLVLRGDAQAVAPLKLLAQLAADPLQRAQALWTLRRLGALDEPSLVTALGDESPLVRIHALRLVAEGPAPTPALHAPAVAALDDPDPAVRRAAADTLGQHANPANIRPLLARRKAIPDDDTHLLHVVKMALRNQLLPGQNYKAAPGGGDAAPAPAPAAAAGDWQEWDYRWTAEVSLGVPTLESARYLLGHLRRWPEPQDWLVKFVRHIARYGDMATDASLLNLAREEKAGDLGHQGALLTAIQQGMQERGATPSPDLEAWAGELIPRLIHAPSDDDAATGIALASAMKLGSTVDDLAALATDASAHEPRRASAVAALAGIDPAQAVTPLARVLADPAAPAALREAAAHGLATINQSASRTALLATLPAAPGHLQSTIAAGLAAGTQGAEALLKAVGEGKASARLLQEKAVALRLAEAKIPDLDARLAELLQGLPPADQALNERIEARRQAFAADRADVSAGAKAFANNCVACHQLNGQGARIGPQLDGVGLRGADRLMEDILDPNRNVDQAFRTTSLALDDGQVIAGLVLREEGDVLILADPKGQEIRVTKGKVEERQTSQLSPMPADFGDRIPEAEFLDLIAFLLSQKPPLDAPTRSP